MKGKLTDVEWCPGVTLAPHTVDTFGSTHSFSTTGDISRGADLSQAG